MSYKSKRKWTLSHLITDLKHLISEPPPSNSKWPRAKKSHRSCIFRAETVNFCLDLQKFLSPLFLSLKIQQVLFPFAILSGERMDLCVSINFFLLLSHTKLFFYFNCSLINFNKCEIWYNHYSCEDIENFHHLRTVPKPFSVNSSLSPKEAITTLTSNSIE